MTINLDLEKVRARIIRRILALTARLADEMKVIFVGLFLVDAKAFAMLPDIAPFAGHAVRPIVDLAVDAANAVKNPVFLLLFKLLQSFLGPFDLGEPAPLRHATGGIAWPFTVLRQLRQFILM
jgi:hypothetical protein